MLVGNMNKTIPKLNLYKIQRKNISHYSEKKTLTLIQQSSIINPRWVATAITEVLKSTNSRKLYHRHLEHSKYIRDRWNLFTGMRVLIHEIRVEICAVARRIERRAACVTADGWWETAVRAEGAALGFGLARPTIPLAPLISCLRTLRFYDAL